MSDASSPRRRDLLRAGAAAGLFGITGLIASSSSARQDEQTRYVFSHSLQSGDRFRVLFRPEGPEGNPVTETVPPDCVDDGPQELQLFIVRAFRGGIELGYRGLYVPEQAVATEGTTTAQGTTAEETTATETTTTTSEETATETTPEGTTTGNETDEGALRQETTTTPANGTTTGNETTANETTTTGNETVTPANGTTETATETTPEDETETGALPEIRLGEWYRVTSSVRCDSLTKMTLEAIERQETTPEDTTTGETTTANATETTTANATETTTEE